MTPETLKVFRMLLRPTVGVRRTLDNRPEGHPRTQLASLSPGEARRLTLAGGILGLIGVVVLVLGFALPFCIVAAGHAACSVNWFYIVPGGVVLSVGGVLLLLGRT